MSNGREQASPANDGRQRPGELERRPRGDLLRDVEEKHVLQSPADGEGPEPAQGAQRHRQDRDDRSRRHNRMQVHALEAQERGKLRLPTGRVQVSTQADRIRRDSPAATVRRERHLGLSLHIRVHAEKDADEGRDETRTHDHHSALPQF